VSDTGVGIPKDKLDSLFTAFGMLEGTRSINKSGTGLGLYLSKKLCDLMNCRI